MSSMKRGELTERIEVRITRAMREALDAKAAREDRLPSQVIRNALRADLAKGKQ